MTIFGNSIISAIFSRFNRQDNNLPADEVTVDIAGTLEEISRQVHIEAKEHKFPDDDFFAPTHVMKPEAPPVVAAQKRTEKTGKRRMLRPDQYENIIENSLSALDLSRQIIDRNRAITMRLKRVD